MTEEEKESESKPSVEIREIKENKDETELDKYRKRMYEPTSKKDIMYMLGNAIKVVPYEEISKYETLEELLQPYNVVGILYPNANNEEVGHWCCLFVMPNTQRLQYFDSYGCYIDENIVKFNEEDKRVKTHKMQKIPHALIQLILKSPYADDTYWNDYPLQSDRISSATCGLWCVTRLKNVYLNEEEFARQYYDMPISMGIEPDLAISALICKIYPEMCV